MFLRVTIPLIFALGVFGEALACAGFDDGARYAFSASVEARRVIVIDMEEQALASEIRLDLAPDLVAASDVLKILIIAHRSAQKLTLIDLRDSDLPQLEYPLVITPDYIDVSPIGETVAILDRGRGVLEIHAIKRRDILLHVTGISSSADLTFSADGSSVYWVDDKTGGLNSVDLWSKRNFLQIAEPGQRLSAMSRTADGLLGFVSNADSGDVYIINLRGFDLIATLKVAPNPGRPWGTADGRYMFIPDGSQNTISAISTADLRHRYTVKVDDRPLSIHSGWLDTVIAVVGASGSVVMLDVESGRVLASHRLSDRPREGIVTSDSKTLAVPVAKSGEFVFLNMRTQSLGTVLQGLPYDLGEASMAISNNLCH